MDLFLGSVFLRESYISDIYIYIYLDLRGSQMAAVGGCVALPI